MSDKRVLFTTLLCQLILWAKTDLGIDLAFGEGYVALTDAKDGDYDGPHKAGGAHYTGLGMDLIMYFKGVWIQDGNNGLWQRLGIRWEGMHPDCRWGGRLPSGDSNHFSFEHEGRW